MARNGHTEEEILRVLREAESGTTVVEVCRKYGISQQRFYPWKKKYAGLGLSELRELPQLREEDSKLKSLVADLSLDRHILHEILKKIVRPRGQSGLAEWAQEAQQLRQRRAVRLIPVDRMTLR